jgi:hypothetical protein
MATYGQTTLVRAIGRWSLAALTINCIIASGIFGLPSVISGLVGAASPFAWLFAAVATALVMACFAEVSSRFDHTGGVYLYARSHFTYALPSREFKRQDYARLCCAGFCVRQTWAADFCADQVSTLRAGKRVSREE